MKRNNVILCVTMLLLLVFAIGGQALASKEIRIYVDGEQASFVDQKPYIDNNGRTLVPFRFLSESLGMSVDWDASNKRVTVKDEEIDRTVKVWIGKKEYDVNGVKKVMDTQAVLTKLGRTMVPVRSVGEALGVYVDYKDVKGMGIVFNFSRGFPEEDRQAAIDKIVQEVETGKSTEIDNNKLPRPSELGTTTGKEMGLGDLIGRKGNSYMADAFDEAPVMIITMEQLRAQPHIVDQTIIFDIWEDKNASDIGDDGKIIVKNKMVTPAKTDLFYVTDKFHNRGMVGDVTRTGKTVDGHNNLNDPWENITVADIKYFGFRGTTIKEILLVKNPEYKGGW